MQTHKLSQNGIPTNETLQPECPASGKAYSCDKVAILVAHIDYRVSIKYNGTTNRMFVFRSGQ